MGCNNPAPTVSANANNKRQTPDDEGVPTDDDVKTDIGLVKYRQVLSVQSLSVEDPEIVNKMVRTTFLRILWLQSTPRQ